MKELLKFVNLKIKLDRIKEDSAEMVGNIVWCMSVLDILMRQKESFERGRKIAKVCNKIDLALQAYMYSTMGLSIDDITKISNICETEAKKKMGI